MSKSPHWTGATQQKLSDYIDNEVPITSDTAEDIYNKYPDFKKFMYPKFLQKLNEIMLIKGYPILKEGTQKLIYI